MLAKAGLVTAIVTELEDGYCHVLMQANLGKVRNTHLGEGAAFLGGGVIGTGVLVSTGIMLVLVPIPIIAGAALATLIWNTYRPHAERTRLGLERALDHLERGTVKPGHQLPERSPSLLKLATEEIRKALGS
jgi:Flp pilus assembly protein TadB